MNWEMINLKGEAFGIFALIFIILSFLETNDRKMFILLAIGSFFYAIHFYYLTIFTAALINFIDVLKNLAVLKYKRNDYLYGFFIVLYITIGIQTGNGSFMNYLFTFATILSITAAFYFKGLSLRIIYLISIIIQLIYTTIGNSITGSLSNLIFIINISSAIFILYRRQTLKGKIKYYKIQLIKNTRKLLGLKYKRYKFI